MPSGVIATEDGTSPTPMAAPAVPVTTLIGVTEFDPLFATYAICGARAIVNSCVVVALGPPFRLMVWPVNTRVVDVPSELVSVTFAG